MQICADTQTEHMTHSNEKSLHTSYVHMPTPTHTHTRIATTNMTSAWVTLSHSSVIRFTALFRTLFMCVRFCFVPLLPLGLCANYESETRGNNSITVPKIPDSTTINTLRAHRRHDVAALLCVALCEGISFIAIVFVVYKLCKRCKNKNKGIVLYF